MIDPAIYALAPAVFVERALQAASTITADAARKAQARGRSDPWAPGSTEWWAARVESAALAANAALRSGDLASTAKTFAQLGAAWQGLDYAINGDAQRRARGNPGAEARRRKAEADNAPLMASAIQAIQAAGMVISLSRCAEMICGDKDPSQIRAVLKRSGLFKRGVGRAWVVDREAVQRSLPSAA